MTSTQEPTRASLNVIPGKRLTPREFTRLPRPDKVSYLRRVAPKERFDLMLAAGFVTLGRLGIVVWGGLYLAPALSRQADSYGPIGVVFGLFTALFASWLAILGGTLIAAVLTESLDHGPGPAAGEGAQDPPTTGTEN